MEVRDEHIPEELFEKFTAQMPECCVEIVVEDDGSILLARRSNEPARGEWFWPGSRIYKGEELESAAHRVANEELGMEVEIIDMVGVYSHFWETSAVGDGPSRHTVNVVFHVQPVADQPHITLDEQHDDYRFLDSIEPDLHEYVEEYLYDVGVFPE